MCAGQTRALSRSVSQQSSPCAAGTSSVPGAGSVSRAYPLEPRVGVGVVLFRVPPLIGQDPEVLLVRRAKEPDRGRWCFPGGSLELGETLAACAAREVVEETGLRLCGAPGAEAAGGDRGAAGAGADPCSSGAAPVAARGCGAGDGSGLCWDLRSGPVPFSAVDVIRRSGDGTGEEGGRLRFHYVVVEVAAVAADPDALPVAGDDADGAEWVRVSRLRGMRDLTVRCDEMAEEAVRRFAAPSPHASYS